MENNIVGCQHYKRKCFILAPCCKKWFFCRFCHNDGTLYNQLNNNQGCKVSEMDRNLIEKVLCSYCETPQPPQQNCQQCKIQFARYFCKKCNLYDDDPIRDIYHCDKCETCVVGKKEDKFHCEGCNICLPKNKKNKHKCLNDAVNGDCPICFDNLKQSGKVVTYFRTCGHWIHKQCALNYFDKQKKNQCPLCNQTLVFQAKTDIDNLDLLSKEVQEFMPDEYRLRKVNVLCNQCGKTSQDQPYNIVGLKCAFCGCYNTTEC